MNFINFEVGNKTYKLRLNTRSTIALEKVIGCNPLNIFDLNGDKLPPVTHMVAILHASLQQLQHGISMSDAYDIFDKYLEEHSIDEFIILILEIYRESGLAPKEVNEEKN